MSWYTAENDSSEDGVVFFSVLNYNKLNLSGAGR